LRGSLRKWDLKFNYRSIDFVPPKISKDKSYDCKIRAKRKYGKRVALANKETLVSFGPFVKEVLRFGELIPVDSEHSSVFQLFQGTKREEVKKLVLTASGGSFRNWRKEEIERARVEDALEVKIHPQSVIHAMLVLKDNSIKIHASKPDMRIPIQYAITYPERLDSQVEEFEFGNFEILPVDREKFPALDHLPYGFKCGERGGGLCISGREIIFLWDN
jgi:1-deoxy-D-xylulose-5-phosphate reductoisomerase